MALSVMDLGFGGARMVKKINVGKMKMAARGLLLYVR